MQGVIGIYMTIVGLITVGKRDWRRNPNSLQIEIHLRLIISQGGATIHTSTVM